MEKKRCHLKLCDFMRAFETSRKINLTILLRIYFFLKNYVTSEGAVSHIVLYYQQLIVACYQVRLC